MKFSLNKKCGKCGLEKSTSEYHKSISYFDGLQSSCKECRKLEGMTRYKSNRNEILTKVKKYRKNNLKKEKNAKLKKAFGITLEQYNQMLIYQNNTCPICNKSLSEDKRASPVDHCHKTGKIRGIICSNCNKGLGYFKDNIRSFEQAIRYLSENK